MAPARSKQQFKFMEAVAHNDIKKPGLSPEKAAEFVKGQSPKGLPKKVKKTKKTLDSAGAGKFKNK